MSMTPNTTPTPDEPGSSLPRKRRRTSLVARGEPMVWLTGGSVAIALIMIIVLLGSIAVSGIGTFWPGALEQITTRSGTFLGEETRSEKFTPAGAQQPIERKLYRTGNYDITGSRFTWVQEDQVTDVSRPQWALMIERTGWGPAMGLLEAIEVDGVRTEGAEAAWAKFQEEHPRVVAVRDEVLSLQKHDIGDLGKEAETLRIALKKIEMQSGASSEEYKQAAAETEKKQADITARTEPILARIKEKQQELTRVRLIVRTVDGKLIPADRAAPDVAMQVSQVVHAYPANQLGLGGKIGVYASRWWEYLTDEPREANTEGGVFPAIFGTVLMTFIMIIVVVPIGVIAAIYLREYAKQGLIVSIVRIAVNNLAGVPSIVYGVFGLGFFCYALGGWIDDTFYPVQVAENVPVLRKSALIWASLTLALLTLPVVIVATEEALAAVPRSMREGSYGCGATKWQTIRRIVLPRALPGIMTGMILAVARGAGEVAPLMLVGAVKLAPELPISTEAPFFGSNRSFMHLGFHIYDLGFQSPDSEGAKPMVYTTTFLLIAIVVLLNLAAMWLRSRLRKSHSGGAF